jgi:iron complex outermembrane recepter protein
VTRAAAALAAALVAAALLAAARGAAAQDSTSARDSTARLAPVRVEVARDRARSPLELPFAMTIARPDSLRPGQRHLGLEETLALVPGVMVATRTNPTQDPRIFVRGFGARSAFGVRGVRVLRDGVPLTLPDGQTPVDYLDLESVGTVEVIRGSASSLYGNAAGGVIDIRSAPPPAAPLDVEARGLAGEDGLRRWIGQAGGTLGAMGYRAQLARTEADGWRAHSRLESRSAWARAAATRGRNTVALQATLYDAPLAENPGSLTLEELRRDPRAADTVAVRKGASKTVRQSIVGLTAGRATDDYEIEAVLHGGTRDLENPIIPRIIDVDRAQWGAGVRGAATARLLGTRHRFTAGAEYQRLDDDRRAHTNCIGGPPPNVPATRCNGAVDDRGSLLTDQRELVTSIGPYVRDEVALGSRARLSAGARADMVRFEVRDRLVLPSATPPNLDESGARTLRAVSPAVGLVVRAAPLVSVYGSVSTAFETPTTTELANRPDSSAGFNRTLDPQRATTFEAGVKGVALGRVEFDAAAYHTDVRDELVQFRVSRNQSFYRNAGRTRRQGMDVGAAAPFGPLRAAAAYSLAALEFREYEVAGESFAGKRIPGVPRHQLQGSLTAERGVLHGTAEGVVSGGAFADDANRVWVPGYELLNLRAGVRGAFGRPRLALSAGVYNVFDRRYVPSIVVNDQDQKFYEPAPGRALFVSLSLAADAR